MTRKHLRTALLGAFLIATTNTAAQNYEENFNDTTLRLDYIFAGTNEEQSIYLNNMKSYNGWYGRRVNMNILPLAGNGSVTVTDTTGMDTIYRHSFSTLFQEWQATEEATRVARSFESTILIPMPKKKVQVTVELKNMANGTKSYLKHTIDPKDILVRKHDSRKTMPHVFLRKAGDSREKIDVVFIPEGYTQEEMAQFRKDCEESIDALMEHKAFRERRDRFNFIAIGAPSKESGVSVPQKDEWKSTTVGSHFDTFYSTRYLTTPNVTQLYDLLDGIPCESIIILANTDVYGGGGIYNNYTLTAAHNEWKRPVVVHEFGHSFCGLADEYYYDDQFVSIYPADIEPWEPNITTLVDFDSKWKDMLPEGTPIPTPADGEDIYTKVGVYEGAGYQSKGAYRPMQDCRMKTNLSPDFCPVCTRAIMRIIDFISR